MNNIKKLRTSFGYTQQELADKMQLSKSTIAMLENGSRLPSVDTLVKLSNIFNVSTDYILGNTTIENPKKEIEDYLSKLNLTEEEYSLYIENAIKAEKLHLPTGNTRIDEIWIILFQIYEDYLKVGYSKNEKLNNLNTFYKKDFTDEEIDELDNLYKPIDTAFLNLLKSLDKNKILHKEQSNVFPTADTPQKYPVLGKISAGLPLLAIENIEGYMYAPSSKIQQGYDYFFLRVQGDSMNLKFPDGCLLLVQKQPELENGQIGVIRVNGDDATVKRFKEENNLIILEPMSSNPEHQVQIYNPQKIKIEIIGKVICAITDIN